MPSTYRIERDRGTRESRRQLAVLREKWPLAFPVKHHDVRPLAIGAAREIAVAMGWSLPYTRGVLDGWKMAPVYSRAVLCHEQRISLDGSSAEMIDVEAKALATKRLVQLPARKATAFMVKLPARTAKIQPETAEELLRARVRASLLRRSM